MTAMWGVYAGALVAGLVGSPHCVGMCGGFAAATAGRPAESAAWQGGRLAAYATLGAIAGSVGGVRLGSTWIGVGLAAVLLVWFAARLAGLAPEIPVKIPWLTRAGSALAGRKGVPARFAFGVLTALLPCGLLWSALAVAVASGGPGGGALAMAAFWLGTAPALAVAAGALRRLASARPWTRRAVAAAVLAAGLWSISSRAAMQNVLDDGSVPPCHGQAP